MSVKGLTRPVRYSSLGSWSHADQLFLVACPAILSVPSHDVRRQGGGSALCRVLQYVMLKTLNYGQST
jgi:hypothetical protein